MSRKHQHRESNTHSGRIYRIGCRSHRGTFQRRRRRTLRRPKPNSCLGRMACTRRRQQQNTCSDCTWCTGRLRRLGTFRRHRDCTLRRPQPKNNPQRMACTHQPRQQNTRSVRTWCTGRRRCLDIFQRRRRRTLRRPKPKNSRDRTSRNGHVVLHRDSVVSEAAASGCHEARCMRGGRCVEPTVAPSGARDGHDHVGLLSGRSR